MMGVPMRGLLALTLMVALAVAGCAQDQSKRFESKMEKASQINAELGAQYLRNGDLQTAKEKLDKALRQDPDNADAHATYALLSMRLGKPEQAREHFETALDHRPDDPKILNNYATFLCQQGDYGAGIDTFLQAAENPLYDTPAYAYANAGRCAREAGQVSKARKYLRKALEADSRMASALLDLARLEYENGRPGRAQTYIQRYHKVATKAPDSLWLAIRIERRLGNRGAVKRLGKALVSEYPDSDEADRFLETR